MIHSHIFPRILLRFCIHSLPTVEYGVGDSGFVIHLVIMVTICYLFPNIYLSLPWSIKIIIAAYSYWSSFGAQLQWVMTCPSIYNWLGLNTRQENFDVTAWSHGLTPFESKKKPVPWLAILLKENDLVKRNLNFIETNLQKQFFQEIFKTPDFFSKNLKKPRKTQPQNRGLSGYGFFILRTLTAIFTKDVCENMLF